VNVRRIARRVVAAKIYRLRPASATPVNGRATLRLKIPKKAKRVFRRALAAKRKLKAVVTVSALGGDGQTLGTATRTIKLKR
jgi:hypothetical protein